VTLVSRVKGRRNRKLLEDIGVAPFSNEVA
jgi:hypothetical protein